MTESNASQTSTESQPSVEEITTIIQELEQYRERLVTETTTTTQKAKLPKSAANALLEPELQKIDAALDGLRQQLATAPSNA